MEKKITKNEYHHHYNIDRVIIAVIGALLVLIIVTTILGMTRNSLEKNEIVYNQCTESCVDVSVDLTWRLLSRVDKLTIQTNQDKCIADCNDMYLQLRGVYIEKCP